MTSPPVSEFTRLCERCGYVLESLPPGPAAVCPECGKPLAQSDPARRAGSPWQRSPSPLAWFRTLILPLRHPRACWDALQIDKGSSKRLLAATVWAAAAIFALPIAIYFALAEPFGSWGNDTPSSILGMVIALLMVPAATAFQAFMIGPALFILTAIERRGIRFFGTRRRWRITPAVAETVCAHAAVGWLISAIAFWAGVAALWFLEGLAPARPTGPWPAWVHTLTDLMPLLPVLGLLFGLLTFETLVYLGMRRCRFANTASDPGHLDAAGIPDLTASAGYAASEFRRR